MLWEDLIGPVTSWEAVVIDAMVRLYAQAESEIVPTAAREACIHAFQVMEMPLGAVANARVQRLTYRKDAAEGGRRCGADIRTAVVKPQPPAVADRTRLV